MFKKSQRPLSWLKDHFYLEDDTDYDEEYRFAGYENSTFQRLLTAWLYDIAEQLGKNPISVSMSFEKKRGPGNLLFDKRYAEIEKQYIAAIDSGATEWVI